MCEADYICVLDTGSTDGTYEALLDYAAAFPGKFIIAQKTYSPWRFDAARQDSLALVPADAAILMCTDLDEELVPGWANDFRAAWTPETTRLTYLYAWSHTEDGRPGRVFWYDKCHSNGEYKWRYPVHETLTFIGERPEKYTYLSGDKIYLHHWPDRTKSRASYLPLLELRAQEDPNDYYGLVYLAHEYFYQGHYRKCVDFIRTSVLPRTVEDDAYLCRTDLYLFMGDSYRRLNKRQMAEEVYLCGIASDKTYRENYLALASLYIEDKKYDAAIELIHRMFAETWRHYSWLERDSSWTYEPYDLLCQAYYYRGAKAVSLDYALLAYMRDQNNARLRANYELIKNELKE